MAARVSVEGAGPSYASVLNFRGGESNKENIEAGGEAVDAPVRQADEEEEGFVPVIAHGRRPAKGRRDRDRRPPPRAHKAPPPQNEANPNSDQQNQTDESQPKKFVEAPIPKVNPWQYGRKTVILILKTIGKGTYGNVYLCENKTNSVLTIVKDVEMNIKLPAHKQDIANEVDILSALNHSNIIKFYDCYYVDNNVMICMEYASSGNLAEYMYRRFPKLIKQQEILFYFCQVLLGVHYIHSLNIIHRDLKAENILLTGKHGTIVKIGDFGISKMLASAKKTSTVIGTPYYLAPELCEGKPYDTKSDVWALGCLLYEMCTHKRAFEAESLVGLVNAIINASVHPIDLNVYDRGVQDLIDSMLSILPDKRPTIQNLMGRMVVLPIIYTVFLDSGNDELLYLDLKDLEF